MNTPPTSSDTTPPTPSDSTPPNLFIRLLGSVQGLLRTDSPLATLDENSDREVAPATETSDSDGVGARSGRDYYPNDANRFAQEIPTLPLVGLLALLGLLGLSGSRKLR